jgi:hypothetical protein
MTDKEVLRDALADVLAIELMRQASGDGWGGAHFVEQGIVYDGLISLTALADAIMQALETRKIEP